MQLAMTYTIRILTRRDVTSTYGVRVVVKVHRLPVRGFRTGPILTRSVSAARGHTGGMV